MWAINNQSWPNISPINVSVGKRYRLVFRNGSEDQHPGHLHRNTLDVVRIGDANMSGLRKDVVNLTPLDEIAVDFQLHMDYGLMQLIHSVGKRAHAATIMVFSGDNCK
jgi:FtsP/CotA-like multicopper oxidase with cupredoxin domain